jgi:amino acid adenylation domain-containing protein
MQPAFGMAEVCTCMTYVNDFNINSGVHWFLKSSLSGALQPAAPESPSAAAFVDLGPPVPGVQIRITDAQNNVLPEGRIGRFQIKGSVVTRGYLLNDAANTEAFVGDGWFNSGDLGFIWNGRLTLTGREKEMIIIRGANFYAYEIEEVVNGIPGTIPTFSAATAVTDPLAGTEGLAVFFVPQSEDSEQRTRLVSEVRKVVASNLGISPAFVVPLKRSEFAKTTSGKIQRNQMRKLLESGGYNSILKEIDLALENENTLPGWFYQKLWRPKKIKTVPVAGPGLTVVFLDALGLGARVCEKMAHFDRACITVRAGTKFEQIEANHFQLNPADPEDYRRLFSTIVKQGTPIAQVLHLATYCGDPCQWCEPDHLDASVHENLIPMLYLIQGLNVLPESHRPIRLLVMSSHSQSIRKGDKLDCTRSAVTGLLKTASQEFPWLQWGHVDLPNASIDDNVDLALMELQAQEKNCERAWRNGRRWVPRLQPVDFSRTSKSESLPFKQGDFYLMTGGLGGIGTHIARYLLSNYQARILIVGRTSLHSQPESSNGKVDEKRKVYEELGRLGCVDYRHVDVSDSTGLAAAVADAKRRWNAELAGIIHLAGVYQECALVDETKESLDAVLRPKLHGSLALHSLIAHSPQALFLSFGSVNGFLGGFSVGAYSVANAFLDSLTDFQRELGLHSYCLNWSLWEETGMSRGLATKDAARARGYYSIAPEQGVHSMLAVLGRDLIHPLIGLDASKEAIRQYCEDGSPELRRLAAYCVSRDRAVDVTELGRSLPLGCKLQLLERMPTTGSGEIDCDELARLARSKGGMQREFIKPRTALENQIAQIWQGLLGIRQIGIKDNFFELGGHSLLATQVVARVRELVRTDVAVGSLFTHPSLEKFAEAVGKQQGENVSPYSNRIQPMPRPEEIPLSFAQQRLWFLAQMEEVREAYHIPFGVRLKGELDRQALRQALDRIVARHEALRTRFVIVEGEPRQRITPAEHSRFQLLEQELRQHGEQERAGELNTLIQQEGESRFDLEKGPLVRGRLIRSAEDEHVLLVTMHHIVSDGWSMGVLAGELKALYGAFLGGKADPLPELEIQYADYALWQRQWIEGEILQQQAAYWKTTLAGAPALLELPTDHLRPVQQSYAGAMLPVVLDEKLMSGLKGLSRSHGTTLYMTLLAGWAILLMRLSGQQDVVIGSPVANRGRAEIENLIGFFVNTLALRLDLSGSPSVSQLLEQTKAQSLAAQRHQDIPFEQVVELAQPVRSLSHSPLFQVMFSWQNAVENSLELPGLEVLLLQPPHKAAQFDLTLFLQPAGDTIGGAVEYASALFEPATVHRYMGYFVALLKAMVADDAQTIDRLPMLSEEEREQVVYGWNETKAEFPSEKCVHELFEEQMRRSPQATAVVFEKEELSYGELNERANQLAWRLRELGVGPETRVGLLAERSLEMVVGLLGVLKAGAAYVPLDPDYPSERLSYMLESAQVKVLLTQEHLREQRPPYGGPVLELDGAEERRRIAEQKRWNLDVALMADHLAYIIYTSGSTGRPKGVMNSHGGLLNRLLWMQKEYRLEPGDVVLQKTPFSFDVSVWEFLWPLLEGAKLVVARPGGHKDPGYLATLIEERQITTLHFVPSMLAVFLDEERPKQCKSIRRVVCSGEALPAELAQRCLASLPWAELHNLYGPTEAAIDVTYWKCLAEDTRASVPIGKAIANIRLYVVDEAMNPVPVGVPGELYLGGVGLARGYWGRGDLTAARFVPDGLSGRMGERLYQTGDLVRWLVNGNLEYLGRLDQQVKIRGFRIELGEIEAVLERHPNVTQAVVLAREDKPGDKRLVAYVVAGQEAGEDDSENKKAGLWISELREHLLSQLPEYMVPTAYVQLKRIPLTPNGKIDRQALPPAAEQPSTKASLPLDEVEENLLMVWQKVLGKENLGVEDNYFALGGDSLRVVQVVHEARRHGIDVRTMDVLRHQTIRALRKALQQERRSELFPHGVPEALLPETQPMSSLSSDVIDFYPVSAIQAFVLQKYAENQGADGIYHIQECFHLEDQSFSRDALEKAFAAVVERHPALRTVLDLKSLPPLQCIRRELPWKLLATDISHLDNSDQEAYIAEQFVADRTNLFDPANKETPLFRIVLFLRSPIEFSVFFSCHHAIMDGWGHQIFLGHLLEAYTSIKSGRAPDLGKPDNTYHEFVNLEYAIGRSEQAAEFWSSYLSGVQFPPLPDFVLPASDEANDPKIVSVLEPEQNVALERIVREHAVSAQALLLAAWLEVLRRWSGDSIVTTGVISNGRSEYLADPLSSVGLFWNVVPVVSRKELPVLQQAEVVQKDLIAVQPYASYPLLKLMAGNGGEELFYSAFRYLNFWNSKQIPKESGLRHQGSYIVDRYPFALTCTVVVIPSGRYLQLEYNPKAVSLGSAENLLNSYKTLLDEITQAVK